MRIGYLRWQNTHLPQSVVLILIALVLGVFTGISAAVLKRLVKMLNELVWVDVKLASPEIRFLIWPFVGILATSVFQRYVARCDVSRGTRIIRRDLDSGHYRLSPYTIFNPVLGCSLTMGLGATGGTEGPTALSGAAIGSNVGRWFGLSDAWLRLLVGIGAAAGIAAIFKSPIGGVLFTLEVLQMQLTSLSILALFIACLFAACTSYLLSDFTFDIFFIRETAMDPHTLGWVAVLGVFCGLYSIYYNYSKIHATTLFSSIRNPWIGAVATGLSLSLGAFLFPALFGEGFDLITELVNGESVSFTASGLFAGHHGRLWLYAAIACILLLKGDVLRRRARRLSVRAAVQRPARRASAPMVFRPHRHGRGYGRDDSRPSYGHFPLHRDHQHLRLPLPLSDRGGGIIRHSQDYHPEVMVCRGGPRRPHGPAAEARHAFAQGQDRGARP